VSLPFFLPSLFVFCFSPSLNSKAREWQCHPRFSATCPPNSFFKRLFILKAYVKMRKQFVSMAISNRELQKINQEASKQKRSRIEWKELHFETPIKPLQAEN
jgi:hypothetical protein